MGKHSEGAGFARVIQIYLSANSVDTPNGILCFVTKLIYKNIASVIGNLDDKGVTVPSPSLVRKCAEEMREGGICVGEGEGKST